MSFSNRKEWGERIYPQVFSVMAQILGRESTPMEDMDRGVDLVMAPAGISVRIRRPKYIAYRRVHDRLNPNEDGKTELDKLPRPPESGPGVRTCSMVSARTVKDGTRSLVRP